MSRTVDRADTSAPKRDARRYARRFMYAAKRAAVHSCPAANSADTLNRNNRSNS